MASQDFSFFLSFATWTSTVRDRLLDLVWGEEFLGESRTVDVHVAKLRKKLKACESIITVPRGGYLFEDDETIREEWKTP